MEVSEEGLELLPTKRGVLPLTGSPRPRVVVPMVCSTSLCTQLEEKKGAGSMMDRGDLSACLCAVNKLQGCIRVVSCLSCKRRISSSISLSLTHSLIAC